MLAFKPKTNNQPTKWNTLPKMFTFTVFGAPLNSAMITFVIVCGGEEKNS